VRTGAARLVPKRRWDLPPDFEYEICHRSLLWTRPKTEAGERLVPSWPPYSPSCASCTPTKAPTPTTSSGTYKDGRPIGPRDDYKAWNKLLIEAKVIATTKHCPMHVARHTTATLLRAAGVDEQTRMEILGHATTDSQRIYAHADQARHLSR
jgi:integrase